MAFAILVALVLGVLWLGVFGLGVIVTLRGVRGRVVDEHPRCARCRYVIAGGAVRPERCPECGGSLHGVGAVRLGLRKAHPPMIAVGALIMLVSLTPSGLFIDGSPAAAAPLVATRAAVRAPVRATTAEQDAMRRQRKKDKASLDSWKTTARLDGDLAGPPAPDVTKRDTTTASAPPFAGDAFGAVPAPLDHDTDWMTRSLGHLVAGGATPAFAVGLPSEPSAPAPPGAPGSAAAGFVSGIDTEPMSFDRGADPGSFLGAHKLIRNGFPTPPGASVLRSGAYDTWEIGPTIGGASPFAGPFAGSRLVPSTRLDHRVAPSYIGGRPGLRTGGPLGGAPGGIGGPAAPPPIDIRPGRLPAGR